MTEIENYIHNYFGIQTSDLSIVADLFKPNTLAKSEFYTKLGKHNAQLSFVKSGHLRVFANSPNQEKEITQWISSKGAFVTDLSSFIFNTPSRFNIQCLTDCELYTISKDDYQKLQTLVPKWTELEKLFIAKCFLTLEDRVFSQLSMTAEERYDMLFQYNPALFNEVPLLYLASMLGMSPETFSRIRKKKSS